MNDKPSTGKDDVILVDNDYSTPAPGLVHSTVPRKVSKSKGGQENQLRLKLVFDAEVVPNNK